VTGVLSAPEGTLEAKKLELLKQSASDISDSRGAIWQKMTELCHLRQARRLQQSLTRSVD
jgi:hypothetical protein